VIDQLHPVLDAGKAVGNRSEAVPPQLFLGAELRMIAPTEWAMIGGDDLEVVGGQTPPQSLLMFLGSIAERG
jgi:hypothetical protein